ncbi:MAG: hypothetical protein GY819_13260, partial [Planctomycetaceae bacterium]|nr:hypothetical protein [Planctomycetaceae bacterium]
ASAASTSETNANAAKIAAAASAAESVASASGAVQSASDASQSANAAAVSAVLAYNWAQQDAGVEVAAGEDSAYQWAQKAAGAGYVVQVVNHHHPELATSVELFSFDDIIPTRNEGDFLMELKITPTHATGLLRIDVVANLSHSANGRDISIGLFDDTATNALACATSSPLSHDMTNIVITHWMTAGTTNEITFIVRGGANLSGTTTLNGVNGSRRHGGVMASGITITEYKV